jgi:hypothetical protein
MAHVAKRPWLSRKPLSSLFNEPDILQHVLRYAGSGQRLFYAAVSTSTSAVFASASRLRWAHESGFRLSTMSAAQWRLAGRVADGDTLAVAHELCANLYACALALGAAEAGSLHALSWLHFMHSWNSLVLPRTGTACIFDHTLMVAAAGAGHVHMLDFLRLHGCPLLASAVNAAASANQVPALRWLHEHNPVLCMVSASLRAAKHGSIEAMAYILPHMGREVGRTLAEALRNMLNAAGCHGQLDAAKWLRQQGAAWPSTMCVGLRRWSGAALEWAIAEGCTSPTSPFAPEALAAYEPLFFGHFEDSDSETELQVLDFFSADTPLSALPADHERVQRYAVQLVALHAVV